MTFHVGQKVICIVQLWNASLSQPKLEERPRYGATYTVRKVVSANGSKAELGDCLLLEEIISPPCRWAFNGESGQEEANFEAAGFRPLVEDAVGDRTHVSKPETVA